MSIPSDVRNKLKRPRYAVPVTILSLAAVATVAYAKYRTIQKSFTRTGTEARANVLLNVPYGNFQLSSGTRVGQLALLQVQTDDMEEDPPMHVRQTMNGNCATLKVTLGTDEGMLGADKPIAGAQRAMTGFSLASAGSIRTEWGDIVSPQAPYPANAIAPNASLLSDDDDRYQLFLTKEIPVSISAIFGFGESIMDWTGLSVTSAYIETGASNARVTLKAPNPFQMTGCKVSAGIGSFVMDGICNLNATRYEFSGGVGYYKLFFNGKLQRDLEARVEVGLGKVTIDIPPDAGRVQIYYDENVFSSFSFQGLNRRRDGYATSVGFDQSTAPILTLYLSSGMGKMEVRYK
jgi:hypothetical protein